MRSLIIVAIVLVTLLGLTLLPVGHAQPQAVGGIGVYLPSVFRAAEATATTAPTRTVTPSLAAATPSRTPAPTQTGAPTATPSPTDPLYTNGQDLYNCSDFSTWDQANAVFQANLVDGDPNKLDQDSDGIPCEGLPGAP